MKAPMIGLARHVSDEARDEASSSLTQLGSINDRRNVKNTSYSGRAGPPKES